MLFYTYIFNKLILRKFYSAYGAVSVTDSIIGLVTLTFDLLTSKYVHGLPVLLASILSILGFLGLSVHQFG